MFGLSYEDIAEVVKKEKGLSDEEIKTKVQEKLNKLSDLISKEGAIHIVANELGVNLFDGSSSKMKIKRVLPGMRSVNILGKIVKIYGIREYKTESKSGKVANILFGDETGVLRLVIWDTNLIKKFEDGEIKEGSVVRVKNSYVRQNNGFKELHVGNQGTIELENANIEVSTETSEYIKKEIKDLEAGNSNVGVFGTIVQVFEPRFYEACPECGKKLMLEGEKTKCNVHGFVAGKLIPILNLFFDDGTGNIRTVAFREQVLRLTGLKEEEVIELRDNPTSFDKIKEVLLGKQVILVGRVVKNEMFDRNEFTVQRVVEVKPEDIIKEIEVVKA